MLFFISSRQFKMCHFEVFFTFKKVFFSAASHPDEALPVFRAPPPAGAAARRRLAGRAGRHRPVCWLELATRQVHEEAPCSLLCGVFLLSHASVVLRSVCPVQDSLIQKNVFFWWGRGRAMASNGVHQR